jgi:hypothetical protein
MKIRSGQPAPQSSFLIIEKRLSDTFRLATAYDTKQSTACRLCERSSGGVLAKFGFLQQLEPMMTLPQSPQTPIRM